MTVKAPSRLSDLVLTLFHTSFRRRLPHDVPRQMHQAVARPPHLRTAPVPCLSNEHLHALYEDLMIPDPSTTRITQPGVDLQQFDALLVEYAKRGNTQDFESLISRIPSGRPRLNISGICMSKLTSLMHHSPLIPPHTQPSNGFRRVHSQSCTSMKPTVISPRSNRTPELSLLFLMSKHALLSTKDLDVPQRKAQAWDLFAHMRYVAHPVPDAHLYSLMIRACGSFSRAEPERALDLWMEMQENGVKPTKGAYEAVIRVCGRAGPEWLGEGMRLAREMSDQYSITGVNGRGLWCALLEGCKRAGDLKKARWILAEAVRDSGDGGSREDSMVDAELMIHMFHTYASYKPPFRRETTRLVDRSVTSNAEVSMNETQVEEVSSPNGSPFQVSTERIRRGDVFADVPVENIESVPSFSRLPPQTPSDVIAETRALFSRIRQDRSLSLEEARNYPQGGLLVGRFAHVELTPVLLNAYLSVFYRHASIETSQEAFNSLFSKTDSLSGQIFHPDEHTYINALERCAIARIEDRHIAARWAKDVWRHWETVEANGLREGKVNIGSYARLIEKAHDVMRRVLILSGDIDAAQALLRSFVSRYPPNAVLQPTDSQLVPLDASPTMIPIKSPAKSTTAQLFTKPPILSTRTVLTNPMSSASMAARPLVRLTSAVSPKDDRVPPIIAFSDVDLLHARLAEHGRVKDLGYIKWVCMAYANALKKRRDAVLKAAPTPH
ncbi:hypothetical protein J3R82DRAFT_8896 [Butyriboletus roseoflavus]|nr:hypothetical protein J3R82DRAFT_8896 [Butyriboletus roseoflavus]